jgi:glycosyltransferase involved in cell wall biosynthesis
MENGVVNVASKLALQGVSTHVACLVDRGSFAERLPEPAAVTVLGKGKGFTTGSVRRLAQLIRRFNPHVVHTHNLGPLVYATLATFGGLTRPILHGEHGQIQAPERSRKRWLMRHALHRCCHTVHTVSEGLKQTLLAEGFKPRRMVAVVNGVDCVRFQPPEDKAAAKASLDLPPDAITLGIVGRFVALKRHQLLLDALRPFMAENARVHLLVLGDHGSERESILQAMKEHPFAERIHWLGMRSDVAPCYQAMDLLVAPSEIEGLSNAVLEAMACGVPALAHAACGNAEAITHGENGFLHHITDAPSLTAALREAVVDSQRLAMVSDQARKRAVSHFSMESMAAGYLKLYNELAAGADARVVSGGGKAKSSMAG